MRVPPPGAGPPAGGNCTRTAPCHAPVCPPKAAWRRRNALTRPHFPAKDSRKPTKAKTVNGALRAVKARQRLLPVRPIPYAAGGSNGRRPAQRVRGNRRRTNASAKAADGAAHISAAQQRHSAGGANAADGAAALVESAAASATARRSPPPRPAPRPLTWAVSRSRTQQSARTHDASGRFGCFFFRPCPFQTGPLCAARPQTVLPFRSICREPSSEPQVCFRRGADLYANVRRADGILPLSVRDAAQAAVP